MSDGLPVVLVVDDEESVRKALARLMQCAGLAVETFSSGAALLARAPKGMRGCVVLDLRMPRMDGLEVQQRLGAMGCNLPVIMITAHDDEDAREKAMRGGAVAYIQKPFDQAALLSAVRAALNEEVREREPA